MSHGRPFKICDKIIDDLIHHVTRGVAVKYAAPACGINPDTYYRWMKQGEEDILNGETTLYGRLYDTISKAKSQFIQEAIENIKKAGRSNKNWQANSWLLEKLYSAGYGKDSLEVQNLARDIDEIKRILGADADAVNQHTRKDDNAQEESEV